MPKPINLEEASLVVSTKKMENGSIQISFDSGSAASVYWLSEDEVMELINDLMDSISARRIK